VANRAISLAATLATVAAGVILAGWVLNTFGDAPILRDARAGLA